MKKILIIEDERIIQEELKTLLENAGYEAKILQNFSNSLYEILEVLPDLILMDINIPFLNGQLLLNQLRKQSNIPVIMLTSRSDVSDEVLSMSYGADDYITKPYNPTLLLLRMQAILKRLERSEMITKYKDATVYIQRGIIKRGNKEIILTKNEMIIFSTFKQYEQQIVSRDTLMMELWNSNEYINDNALTVNISRLRSKLKELGYDEAIETRKGLGYILL